MNFEDILKSALENKASDIILTVGLPPMLRIDGELKNLGNEVLTDVKIRRMIYSILNERQREYYEMHHELDFSVSASDIGRFRVNLYQQKGNIACALRIIPNEIPSFEELGLPPIVKELASKKQGLILVTGASGQGKSTTQAAMLDYINKTRRCHIITIEDPIEFVHTHHLSAIDQREVGSDTESFHTALKYVLRQNPDVIFIGEMRDKETVSTTITAAETGHLVISTLHTNDAVQAIDRIIDIFPGHQQQQIRTQLAFCLVGIICQQLIPRKDGKGRVLAVEILLNNTAVANVIREGRTYQAYSIMQTSAKSGMITMDMSIMDLYEKGLITKEEALRRLKHPRRLQNTK